MFRLLFKVNQLLQLRRTIFPAFSVPRDLLGKQADNRLTQMPTKLQKGPQNSLSTTVSNKALLWGGVGNGSDYSGLFFWWQQY
jgi:hypothetical protein